MADKKPWDWAREAWSRATDNSAHEPNGLGMHTEQVITEAMLQVADVAGRNHSRGYVEMMRVIRESIGAPSVERP